jgi:hypothetical protein
MVSGLAAAILCLSTGHHEGRKRELHHPDSGYQHLDELLGPVPLAGINAIV